MSYKSLMYIMVIVIALNIMVLYWLLFTTNARVEKLDLRRSTVSSLSAQRILEESGDKKVERNVTFIGPTQTCADCPDRITVLEDGLAELKLKIKENQNTPTITTSFGAQELFVPIGSGESLSNEWEDITGAASYIDQRNYQSINKVYFEGTLTIPTGQGKAYVRLYNKTDDHPVWFSEVSTETDNSFTFQSDPITLDSGNKLYHVQMKNSLGVRSLIDSARIRILLK